MQDNKGKSYTMHVLSHTHWDREWYQDFQGFRQRLVFQIDCLMDLLEQKPEYKHFHLDGQTICLKDYLRIRPENRERLAGHLRSKRILVGPWFVMPDELLLSGESMVRNLALGHKICAEFGVDPMPVGYVTDIFGHCSQFPQIVRGFGIDAVCLQRGTGNVDEASEILWEGADGSEVLLLKVFPDTSYMDFLHFRDRDDETILEFERRKIELARAHVMFALDGSDHAPAHWDTPEVIERWNRVLKNTKVIHSSMSDFAREVKSQLGDLSKAGLPRYRGELRRTMKVHAHSNIFNGIGSSRVYLKQRNDELEYLLPRCAEYMHAWSVKLGGDSQKSFLNLAWEYLITNHPHDSIVGCSIDQVHRDMMYRFDQARLLASNSIGESMQAIDDKLDTASLPEVDWALTVHNPASVERAPVSEFRFDIPSHVLAEKRKAGLEPRLFNEQGAPVYFEVLRESAEGYASPTARKHRGPSPSFYWAPYGALPHTRFYVRAAASIPPMSFRTFAVRFVPDDKAEAPKEIQPVVVDRDANTIENEFIRLTAREDGLIDILDKSTGVVFKNLHELEDCGDAGHGWSHLYPARDRVIMGSDPGAKSRVKIRMDQGDKLSATAAISFDLSVPKSLIKNRKARSRSRVSVPITIEMTVRAGSRRVDCVTTIRNTAKHHRLRAIFPTSRKTDVWYGDNAFDVVERAIRLPDTTGYVEPAREETPIKNFAAALDSKAGLAILTHGLCEACVQDKPDRPLALTLFRGFQQLIGQNWTQDSQLLGELAVRYSIVPLAPGKDAPAGLFREVEDYKMPVFSMTTEPHPGEIAPSARFLEIPDGLVISTVKTSEDGKGTVVRLFNPGSSEVSGTIRSHIPIRSARTCDMLERDLEELTVKDEAAVEVRVGVRKVVTLKFE